MTMLHSNRHSKLGPRVGTLPSGIVITTRAAALLLGRSVMSKHRVRMSSEVREFLAALSALLRDKIANSPTAQVRKAQKRGTPHAHGNR